MTEPTQTIFRQSNGLISSVNYKFTPEGWVDWRAMIKPEFLYPNKDRFSGGEIPDSIEGLEDSQLLCKLGGYKEVARLRGFKKVSYQLTHLPNSVSAICTIIWMPNFETDGQEIEFSSTANASLDNVSGFGAKFMETFAENRSFVRAVRNFLNIHIVGDDEIDKSKNKVVEVEDAPNPLPNLQSKLREKIISSGCKNAAEFKEKLKNLAESSGKFEYNEKWEKCDDVPTKESRIILGLLNKEG